MRRKRDFFKERTMDTRLGFVGIIVDDRRAQAEPVNRILSRYGEEIAGRMGLPYKNKGCRIITLIVDMSTDRLGALTGELGTIPGVSVKSALSKKRETRP